MVKADATRDYYADLEVAPDCSTEEIKKQFRKLALKYHPDRNPGHEIEYQSRFQAIQAAHEILADPAQRREYDLNRKRGTVNTTFSRPPPPRRNNPYKATTDFPPPPRRTAPRNGPPGRDSPAASAGAERYAHFGRPPPTPLQRDSTGVNRDAKERANMFTAWQQMHHASKGPPPPPRNAGPFASTHTYQGPKKPANPPPESFGARNDHSPPRPSWEDISRQKPNLQRQNSTRAPRKGGFDPSTPDGDESPAGSKMYSSTHFHRDAPPQFQEDVTPASPPRRPVPAVPRSAPDLTDFKIVEDIPFTEGEPRQRTPYTTNPHEKTFLPNEGLRRSASGRDWGRQANFADLAPPDDDIRGRRRSSGDMRSRRSPTPEGSNATSQPFKPFVEFSSDEEDHAGASTANDESMVGDEQNGREKSPLGEARTLEEQGGPPTDKQTNFRNRKSATFAVPSDTNASNRTSHPEIRPRASDSDLQSSVGPNEQASSSGRKLGDLPRSGSHQDMLPLHNRYAPHDRSPMADPENVQVPPPSQNSNGAFPSEQWSQNLSQDNWASRWAQPEQASSSTSPTRANIRKSRGSSNRPGVVPQPATIADEVDEEAVTELPSPRNGGPPRDDDAMDIDPRPPSSSHPSFRHVWAEPPYANRNEPILPAPNPVAPPPPPASSSEMPPPRPPTQRSSSNLTMDSFRHVAPFSTNRSNGAGITDMKDLSEELPFKSQPSASHPTRSVSSSFEFTTKADLPKVPKPPEPPTKLTKAKWEYYLAQMNGYISAWNKFNSTMVAYFQDRAVRQTEMEYGSAGGMVDNWLGAVGGTATLGGFDTYVKGLKDDERVRTHWNVANERHMKTIESHSRLRKMVADGSLKG